MKRKEHLWWFQIEEKPFGPHGLYKIFSAFQGLNFGDDPDYEGLYLLSDQNHTASCTVPSRPSAVLKGLDQANIIKKSVILFRLFNMII